MTGPIQPPMTDERLDRLVRQLLTERGDDVAADALTADAVAERIGTRLRPSPTGRTWVLVAAALLTALLIGGTLAVGGQLHLPWLPPAPQTMDWTGPLRLDLAAMPVINDRNDGRDAAVEWIDIQTIRVEGTVPLRWTIELAGFPPKASTLNPTQRVIEYGVVLDTNADGGADLVIGINNDAPETAGTYRVWVSNLATGSTRENTGPLYGFPIEFVHPDEQGDGVGSASVILTFLQGSAPSELYAGLAAGSVRYYAWASMTDAGRVAAWDYAPDAAWLAASIVVEP